MSRKFTHIAEPFSDMDSYETHEGNTIEVGETYDVMPTYLRERLTGHVVRIYNDPKGLPGGRFDRADGHVCRPTAVVEFDVPEGHEYEHMDGETERVESLNMDYSLGLRDDE